MALTPIPTFPPLGSATFNADAYAWAVFMAGTHQTELDALVTAVDADAVAAAASEVAAALSETAAAASEAAAAASAATAGAVLWVSGTTYAVGAQVYSPVTYLTYRRIIAGAGATDPSADATNWILNGGNVTKTGAETLTNKTLTAPTLADSQLIRAMLIDCAMTVVDKGNSGTSTQTYDYTAGSVQTSTATGNHTIATSNWPPTGNLGSILIQLTNGGAYTLTWPTISWIKPDGTTTTSISTYLAALAGRTALQTSGMDQIMLWSLDAGTTIYGKFV